MADCSKVLKIGLTGGIGSGKSVVCRMFGLLGVAYYDSDSHARRLMTADPRLTGAIRSEFGDDVYRGGELNRVLLAERVFGDRQALSRLNALVHPAVMRHFEEWAAEAGSLTASGYVIMESAIIFDHNLQQYLDKVITVSAPAPLRVDRTMARDGARREKIVERMANQMDEEHRNAMADFVILNDEEHLVWPQVIETDRVLRQLSRAR